MIKTQLIAEQIKYDGSQLASHWIYRKTGLSGDCLAAFIGPCDVSLEAMADIKDQMAGESIAADSMAHFIAELFGRHMEAVVLYQRTLITVIKEVANTLRTDESGHVKRDGDDLYLETVRGRGKLSVSIATVSPVSGLIHAGVNLSAGGVPVAAAGLDDLRVEGREFAEAVLSAFAAEVAGIEEARVKTRGVR